MLFLLPPAPSSSTSILTISQDDRISEASFELSSLSHEFPYLETREVAEIEAIQICHRKHELITTKPTAM